MNAVEATRKIEKLVGNSFPRCTVAFMPVEGFRGIAFRVLGQDGQPKTLKIRVPARHYKLINKAWLVRAVASAPEKKGRLV